MRSILPMIAGSRADCAFMWQYEAVTPSVAVYTAQMCLKGVCFITDLSYWPNIVSERVFIHHLLRWRPQLSADSDPKFRFDLQWALTTSMAVTMMPNCLDPSNNIIYSVWGYLQVPAEALRPSLGAEQMQAKKPEIRLSHPHCNSRTSSSIVLTKVWPHLIFILTPQNFSESNLED